MPNTVILPGTLSVQEGQPALLSSATISGNFIDSYTLTAQEGVLLEGPPGIVGASLTESGSGSGRMVISGSAPDVTTALAAIGYIGTIAGQDTLVLSDTNTTTHLEEVVGTIAVNLAAAAAPAGFTWGGDARGDWTTPGDWTIGGQPVAATPGLFDQATLAANGGFTTIDGLGAAAALLVDGDYRLTGAVDVAGSVTIGGSGAGTLALFGSDAQQQAALLSASATILGAENLVGEVDLTNADWINGGGLSVGGAAPGLLAARAGGTLATGALSVAADGRGEFGPASTLTVGGALVDDGLLTILGSASLGTLALDDGSSTVLKGLVNIGTLLVAAGALLGGAAEIAGIGSLAPTLIDNGVIEAAVAFEPIALDGPVQGGGTLLDDPGGGFVLGTVASGITLTFAPGVSPVYVGDTGAAGGVAVLTTPSAFAGTIEGFGFANQLAIDPAAGQTITGAVIIGSTLELINAQGTILDAIAFDPSLIPQGASLLVTPVSKLPLFGTGTTVANEVVLELATNGPRLTTTGNLRDPAGELTSVPDISGEDPAAFVAGQGFTLTLSASSGTLSDLLSLPSFINGLLSGTLPSTLASFFPTNDGSSDLFSTLELSGSGTAMETISGNDLSLINLQTALSTYQAAAQAGSATITATLSDGTLASSTTLSVDVTPPGSGTSFSWVPGRGNAFSDAGNWSGANGSAGPPEAGDSILLGPGSYQITGDGSGDSMVVTGSALLQGAIYLAGTTGGPTLLVEGGGDAAFAGLLYVTGDAVVGGSGGGELDLVGVINVFTGSLTVGAVAAGYLQVDSLTAVYGDVDIGTQAAGAVDITSDPVSAGGLGALFSALHGLLDTNAILGVAAGETSVATVAGAGWTSLGTLSIGGQGGGILQLVNNGGDFSSEVSAAHMVIGGTAGGTGQVIEAGFGDIEISGDLDIGTGGSGTLTMVDSSFLSVNNFEVGETKVDNGFIQIGGVAGGTGTLDLASGQLYARTISVGSTVANSGTGVLQWNGGDLVTATIAVGFGGTFALGNPISALYAANLDIGAGGLVLGTGQLADQTLVNNGVIDATGTLEIQPQATLTGAGTLLIGGGGTLLLDGNVPTSQTIAYDPGGPGLLLLNPFVVSLSGTAATAPTTRLSASLTALAPLDGTASQGMTATALSGAAGTLDISYDKFFGGTFYEYGTLELLTPGHSFADFRISNLGSLSVVQVACYAEGTRLATAEGDCAVEHLAVGARMLTASGAVRAVRWIGQRRVHVRRHADPQVVQPVRILAGAFGPGRPRRDLLLSPDHCVFLHGLLIPARHLVNGASVVQLDVPMIRYFHVELDEHDILLAEGLPAESYLECGNRHQFEGEAALSLHPDFTILDRTGACAPLCTAGPALAAAQRDLMRRLPGLGFHLAPPRVDVVAGGRALGGVRRAGWLRVALPAGTTEIFIRSGAAQTGGGDARHLGVCLSGVYLDRRMLALDGTALRSGFHSPEEDVTGAFRWTSGNGRLVVAPSRQTQLLELSVREIVGGWSEARQRASFR